MTVMLQNAVEIERPIQRVFEIATTIRHWPEWHPTCIAVRGDTDRPSVVGDEATEDVAVGSVKGSLSWMVSECEAPHRWAVTTTRVDLPLLSRVPATISYLFGETSRGAVVVRTQRYELPTILSRLLDRLYLRRKMRRQCARAVENLKEMIEAMVR